VTNPRETEIGDPPLRQVGAGPRPTSPSHRHRTLAAWITHELNEDIRSGRLASGTRLLQDEVAKRFNVSASPVREAFAALQRQGLVESVAHKGVVVFKPTIADLVENYEIRVELESLATKKAVPNLTGEDLAALRSLLDKMRSSSFDDSPHYYELNTAFHSRIYQAARRPTLLSLIANLRSAAAAYQILFARLQRDASETEYEHETIFAACEAGSPAGAAKAMRIHLQHTVDVVRHGLASESNDNTPLSAVRRQPRDSGIGEQRGRARARLG
jgi:DNA-binding GntR family transcriptional regulator